MENILDKTILELAHEKLLGARVTNCLYLLRYSDNTTLRDIVKINDIDLLGISGFGITSLKELSAFLKQHGLWTGMTDEEIDDYDKRMGTLIREEDRKKISWDRLLCDAAISIAPHIYREYVGNGSTLDRCAEISVKYSKLIVDNLKNEIMNEK